MTNDTRQRRRVVVRVDGERKPPRSTSVDKLLADAAAMVKRRLACNRHPAPCSAGWLIFPVAGERCAVIYDEHGYFHLQDGVEGLCDCFDYVEDLMALGNADLHATAREFEVDVDQPPEIGIVRRWKDIPYVFVEEPE